MKLYLHVFFIFLLLITVACAGNNGELLNLKNVSNTDKETHPFIDILFDTGASKTQLKAKRIGKYLIMEGDMIIGKVNEIDTSAAIVIGKGKLWPRSEIPYVIADNHPERKKIIKAINLINEATNICLVPRQNETDHIRVRSPAFGTICQAEIGFQGGVNIIDIANCSERTIQHEFLHALGMYHEQNRSDRDDYVKINFKNIIEGEEHNFEKYPTGSGEDVGEYDYNSIMHYSRRAFAEHGWVDTITPIKRNVKIGNRKRLSKVDIKTINDRYKDNCKQQQDY